MPALDQLVLEPTRGEVILDVIMLSGAQDPVHDVNVGGLIGNNDHNFI